MYLWLRCPHPARGFELHLELGYREPPGHASYDRFHRHGAAMESTLGKKLLDSFTTCPQCEAMGTSSREWRLMLPLPPVLVVQLKRWKDRDPSARIDAARLPVSHAVAIDSELHLHDAKYELIAVVQMHTRGAHYTTFTRRTGRNQTTAWYHYNDDVDSQAAYRLVG